MTVWSGCGFDLVIPIAPRQLLDLVLINVLIITTVSIIPAARADPNEQTSWLQDRKIEADGGSFL